MALLGPAALALALLALPILLLYMLRLRRREQVVSSTLLWRDLARDRAANAPWQRLRRNLLLFLQLLILAALVLALARPALRRPGAGGDVIILLDASASMQATDGARGTRFDDAVAAVETLIDGLDGDDRMTLIRAGRTPAALVAASGDRATLRRALAQTAPESTAADWASAFALASASVQGLGRPRIFIVSDGGLPEGLPALPGEVVYVPVGESGDNLALTAMAARDTAAGTALLTTATNPGDAPREAVLSLWIDGALVDSRRLSLAAGEQGSQSWTLPGGAAVVETRLEARNGAADHLSLDDRAWVTVGSEGQQRVLLIGEGNLFLERFFAVLPGYELVRASAEEAELLSEDEPFDLYIFDGVPLPDGPLPGNTLVFNPQPGATGAALTAGDIFTDTSVIRLAGSPLLENVDWGATAVAEARQVTASGLESLIAAGGGPLLLAGEIDGRRVVIFPFDLRASDLPLQVAFPVIMANIAAWLSPGSVVADENPRPGAAVTILPAARVAAVQVTMPDGTEWQRPVLPGEPLSFAQTEQPGVYRVAFVDEAGNRQPAGAFAVNFLDAAESSVRPAEALRVGATEITAAPAAVGWREWWPWLVGAALGLLLIEWWVAYRPVAQIFSLRHRTR